MYYLDPKNDITFKKVFGNHPRVLISFLNALLPLEITEPIVDIEYMNPEILPDIPQLKNTIVDIRCKDAKGRHFLVEMQLIWSESFESRILYNASKAFSQQINRGNDFKMLSPVYSLSIVNQTFTQLNNVWYHHYKISHQDQKDRFIEGLEFVLIELPNFIPANIGERKLSALWLRFLKEIKNRTTMIPEELMEVPAIAEAVEALKVTSYNKEELEQYEKYWDIIRTQNALVHDALKKGKSQEKRETANRLKDLGYSIPEICKITGLNHNEVEKL